MQRLGVHPLVRAQQRPLSRVRSGALARQQKARLSSAPGSSRGVRPGAIAAAVVVTGAAYLGLAYASRSLPEHVQRTHPAMGALQFGRDVIAKIAGEGEPAAPATKTTTVKEPAKQKTTATVKKSEDKREAGSGAGSKATAPAATAGVAPISAGESAHAAHAGQPLPADLQAHLAVLSDLEATLLKDLDKLDENALRYRVVQLAAEFVERTKWEALRLSQAIKNTQEEIARQYMELMAQQRIEFDFEVKKALMDREDELRREASQHANRLIMQHEEDLQQAIRQKTVEFEEKLKTATEEQAEELKREFNMFLNSEMTKARKEFLEALLEKQQWLEQTKVQLEAVKQVHQQIAARDQSSLKAHAASASALVLEKRLETSKPCAAEVDLLKEATKGDPFYTAVLDSLPSNALAEGVPTVDELQARFPIVREQVRKAALAPEFAPSFFGQIIGSVFALLTVAPNGMVSGGGVEETLARVAYYVDRGDLTTALRESSSIKGYPAQLMSDWLNAVEARLVVEQAVVAIRAHGALQHFSFV